MFYRYFIFVFLFFVVFILGVSSAISFAAVNPTPTRTKTITPVVVTTTPTLAIQKTEVVVFDNVTIEPGQKIVSDVYDVSNYKEVTMFLSSKPEPYNIATCFFVTTTSTTDRFKGLTITAQSGSGANLTQVGANGRVLGPRMVCEVLNQLLGTTVSLSLYFIP
jgi:hypothetical protein